MNSVGTGKVQSEKGRTFVSAEALQDDWGALSVRIFFSVALLWLNIHHVVRSRTQWKTSSKRGLNRSLQQSIMSCVLLSTYDEEGPSRTFLVKDFSFSKPFPYVDLRIHQDEREMIS